MPDAYVETTVLTNYLLKVGSKKQNDAAAALKRYQHTLLPVYAIKEWKAGPLQRFAWLHDKFVQTRSLRSTLAAIDALTPYKYLKSTAQEAWTAAAQLEGQLSPGPPSTDPDRDLADRYRLALASLIIRSWRKRRNITDETVDDLDCYTETEPRLDSATGLFQLEPTSCDPERECCLKAALIQKPKSLSALRDAIPPTSKRNEDVQRRRVLKELVNTPKLPLTPESCRRLGDAIFAFFCPENAVVLTTNLKDHKPLAQAIGKDAEKP